MNEEKWPEMVTPFVGCGVVVQDILKENIVVIQRKYPPHGYAFPAGMMDVGESVETCAIRETKEETNLDIKVCGILTVISEPIYDPRWHAVSIYMVGENVGQSKLKAKDDALEAFWIPWNYYSTIVSIENKMTKATKLVLNDYRIFRERQLGYSVLGKAR